MVRDAQNVERMNGFGGGGGSVGARNQREATVFLTVLRGGQDLQDAHPPFLQVTAKVTGDQGADCHDVADTHWINGHPTPIANHISGYPHCVLLYSDWAETKEK